MRAGRPRFRVGRFRQDCPSRESRRKRTDWMVGLNPDLTIPSWLSSFFGDNSIFFCFRQARPLPPTTGQIIRVGNNLCFKKNVFKSHGFNWFHGLRRPGRQGCFRQARPLPPTTGQIIRVGNKLCFKKNVFKSHGFNWFHGLRRPGRQGCFRQAGPPPHEVDHTRVKQRIFMACREKGPCRAKSVVYLLNMDAQDKQDKQHERLCHRSKPA